MTESVIITSPLNGDLAELVRTREALAVFDQHESSALMTRQTCRAAALAESSMRLRD